MKEVNKNSESGSKRKVSAESTKPSASPRESAAASRPEKPVGKARLQERYEQQIRPAMQKQFGYRNPMQVPKVVKVSVNMGVGESVSENKAVESAVGDLGLITGQKPLVTRSKKAIAAFKLREDIPIGCKVTLRKRQMYEFMDRLVHMALPRVRDFRGLSPRSFDKGGNYTFGLKEQIVFPEINYDKMDKIRGMDITIVTTAKTAAEAKALLAGFNFPFRQ